MAIDTAPQISVTYSVLIPTHNRPRLLRACVESVLAQTFPPERFEIIVVDDGSRIPAARVLRDYLDTGRVRVLRQPQQGWARARQLGAREARGEILVFLDDDCRAPEHWLEAYARVYAAHPATDGVGGALRPGRRMNAAGCKQYRGHLDYFRSLNRDAGMHADPDTFGRVTFTFGGNRSFRRDIWLEAQTAPGEALSDTGDGGRNSTWYFDDTEIDLRLRELGACIAYTPEAWVTHAYDLSLPQRLQAAFRYGRSEASLDLHSLPALPQPAEPSSLPGRWRRLRAECPGASFAARLWYAFTQPLAWIARKLGQRAANRHGTQ